MSADRISRRDFLRLGGSGFVGATLLGAAGCGGGGGNKSGGQNGGGTGGNSANGGLVVGYDQEPPLLNPLIAGADQSTNDLSSGILDSPLQIQPDLSYAPELADGMPSVVSKDPFVVQYKLKKGLKWSDGKLITSADAKFTYEQISDKNNKIISRQGWDKVSKFETPDARTVRITFQEPYAPWQDLLGNSFSAIFPKHVYEKKDFNTALNNEIVGSGPYRLESWKKGQDLTWVRNENYWGSKPKIKSVTFRFIPDTNSLNASLRTGEVQFINPPPDIGLQEKLKSFSGVKVESAAGAEWEQIAFNLDKVKNLKLRQAIAYGIDREKILNKLLPGQAKPLQSVLVPQLKAYYTPAWSKYKHDPGKARGLAQQAKAEGASMDVNFSTTADANLRETLQQVVQQQLKDFGININIKNTAAATIFGQWLPKGNFEMGEWAWLATADPSLTMLLSSNAIPPAGYNYYRYRSQKVTQLLEQSDVTTDEGKRAELLKQAQGQTAADLPLIPMYQRPVTYAYSEKLAGPKVNPSAAGPFWNVNQWSLR